MNLAMPHQHGALSKCAARRRSLPHHPELTLARPPSGRLQWPQQVCLPEHLFMSEGVAGSAPAVQVIGTKWD